MILNFDLMWKRGELLVIRSIIELESILSSEPVLSIYYPKSMTEIHCDTSIDDYRAVLMQQSLIDNQFHHVYFASKSTTDVRRKYAS